jgi:3-oxoacyl-ACP reductase-like protein
MPLSDIPTVFKHLARRLFTAFPMAKPISLQGKIAIVTGASPGSIGYETAKTLASWGCTVIVTTRSNTQSCVHTMVAELKNKHLPHAISGHSLNPWMHLYNGIKPRSAMR